MKEPSVIPDIQLTLDSRGIPLNQVGVSGVEIPLRLELSDGGEIVTPAVCRFGVSLSPELKGVHMSRFISILSAFSALSFKNLDLRPILLQGLESLQTSSAEISLDFRYFLSKKAPVTGETAPMSYECSLKGRLERALEGDKLLMILGICVPVSNACPCSKAISQMGAHCQRVALRANLLLNTLVKHDIIWLASIISELESVSSSPVYPLLKRPDEKHVTEKQYNNPKFVEDITRDAALLLRNFPGIKGFHLKVEAFESIHAHNACASYSEAMEDIPWSLVYY